MLYSSHYLNNSLDILSFERLPVRESFNTNIEFIPLRHSARLNKSILALEDVSRFMKNNSHMSLIDVLEEVAYINQTDLDSIVFSVEEGNVYLDESVENLYRTVIEAEVPVFLKVNRDSIEGQFVDALCEVCFQYRTVEPIWGLVEDYEGAAASGTDFLGGMINMFGDTLRNSGVNVAHNKIDNFASKYLDAEKKEGFVNSDGKADVRTVKDRNAKVVNNIMGSKIFNNSLFGNQSNNVAIKQIVGDSVEGARRYLTSQSTNLLQKMFGVDPNKPFNVSNVISNIGDKINRFRNGSNPQNSGFINQIINALTALKNQLMSVLRGKG